MGALHLNLGATHIRRHESAPAFSHLHDSQRLFGQAKVRDLLPEMYRRLAEAYLAQGDLVNAREEAARSLAIAEELAVPGEQGLAWRVMGVIDAAEGRLDKAETSLEKAVDLLRSVGDDYGLACAQLSLAELYDGQDQTRPRNDLLAECKPTFDRLGAAIEIARAEALIAASAV